MTQEELDFMISGGLDDVCLEDEKKDNVVEVKPKFKSEPLGYSQNTAHYWPYPATDENKMVCQLDDVTRESEEKASEIFDIVEEVSQNIVEGEELMREIIPIFEGNAKFFSLLRKRFPDVKAFDRQFCLNNTAIQSANEIIESFQELNDELMSVMDTMQYQDIHRQKIERVINVMRSLSGYMNTLLEGKVEDTKRVSSAQHIIGDTHNEVASLCDIDDLLAQFGKK